MSPMGKYVGLLNLINNYNGNNGKWHKNQCKYILFCELHFWIKGWSNMCEHR